MEFKDIFIELRKERKYTQECIAKVLNVSKSTIAMWETGERKPSTEKYEEVADFFNVDMDYLYGKTTIRRKVNFDNLMIKEPNLSDEVAYLNLNILSDKELQESLKKYFALSEKEQSHVRELIDLLSR